MGGTIIEFVLLLIAHAAVGIYSSALKYSKKRTYAVWGTWIVLQTVLLFFSEFVFTALALQFFVGFVLPLIGQYVLFFVTTKGPFAQRIFMMLTYSIFFCIVIIIYTMVKNTLGQPYWILTALIQAVLLLSIVRYFLRHISPLCCAAAKNIATGWIPLISVNIVFLITIILSSVFPERLTSFSDPDFISFIFLSASIMSVYPVIFSSINNLSEAATKREVETQNKLLIAQIEAKNAQLAADSQARHDRRHHNLVMLEFANNNDIESVRQYLKSLVERDSASRSELQYCDNMTIDTVLTVYKGQAEEKGITVKISAKADRDLDISPQDLVIVIGNLFENAIHAVAKLKSQQKVIDISIKGSTQRLLIKIDNPCRNNLTFDESLYGIGIRSVIATANKYTGMYDFTAEEGIFSAKISLNLK